MTAELVELAAAALRPEHATWSRILTSLAPSTKLAKHRARMAAGIQPRRNRAGHATLPLAQASNEPPPHPV